MKLEATNITKIEGKALYAVSIRAMDPIEPAYMCDMATFTVAVPGSDQDSISVIQERALAKVRALCREMSAPE